jgi:ABC-2 type transport system permease protein
LTAFIFRLTLRQLIVRRTTLLLAGLAFIPVLVAVVFQLSDPDIDPQRWTARTLYVGLIVTAVLPLTALLLGTSVLGDEIEEGTIIYLLTKPVPRWQILLPKLAAAWLVATALVVASTVVSGLIALDGAGGRSIITGFAVAVVLGALAYTALFMLLSVATSRALIAGVIYVFIWEGAITSIFAGTRYLSLRHYTLAIADWIAGVSPVTFDAYVSGTTGLVMMIIAIVAFTLYANQRLQRLDIREPA